MSETSAAVAKGRARILKIAEGYMDDLMYARMIDALKRSDSKT